MKRLKYKVKKGSGNIKGANMWYEERRAKTLKELPLYEYVREFLRGSSSERGKRPIPPRSWNNVMWWGPKVRMKWQEQGAEIW